MTRHPVIQQEWQRLFDLFAARLLDLRPDSVLDIGTGNGMLLTRLAHAGIDAVGLEASPITPNETTRIRADAAALPFQDNAFDWVTLRHVPHHLPDVPAAFKEASRVARSGVLIAEPWFDSTDPMQCVAERWDRWWKRQHERAGKIHRPCMSAAELQTAFPEGNVTLTMETFRQVVSIPIEAIDDISLPLVKELDVSNEDKAEWNQIRGDIDQTGFTYNGTLIMTARKGEPE